MEDEKEELAKIMFDAVPQRIIPRCTWETMTDNGKDIWKEKANVVLKAGYRRTNHLVALNKNKLKDYLMGDEQNFESEYAQNLSDDICSKFNIPSPKVVNVEEIEDTIFTWFTDKSDKRNKWIVHAAQAIHQLIYGKEK